MIKFFAKVNKNSTVQKIEISLLINVFNEMKSRFLFILFLPFFLVSCSYKDTKSSEKVLLDSVLNLQFAKGFRVTYTPNYKKVELLNNNDQKVVERYYLVQQKQAEVPSDGQKIVVPLQKIAIASNTHIEFLSIIGELDAIAGVCSPDLIYNDSILIKCRVGEIVNLGDAFSLNLERLIFLSPDVLFVSGFDAGQQDGNKRIIQTGISVVSNNEWKETTLLGRAEWIKFMALFFNKEALAETFFEKVVDDYFALKQKVESSITERPQVMTGGGFKGTWYVPSGRSYMSNLLLDAGGDYVYKNDTTYESLPLSFEQILHKFSSSDVWVGAPANCLSELKAIDERYAMFAPIKNGRVYNFNARKNVFGANDFWESGVAHPELILSDLIKIFHPKLLPEHDFFYVDSLK